MKRNTLFLLAAMAVLSTGCGKSPAYKAFVAFQKAARNGNCMELRAVADGAALKWVEDYCSPAGGMTVFGQTISGKSAADYAAEMSGSPAWAMQNFRREIESEEKQADGSRKLVIVEHALERPSNFSKPAPPRRYRVTAKEFGEVWKLTEYADEEVKE
jgi:hypothetical protein